MKNLKFLLGRVRKIFGCYDFSEHRDTYKVNHFIWGRRTNLMVTIMIFIVLRVTLTSSVPISTHKLMLISPQYGGGVEFLAK